MIETKQVLLRCCNCKTQKRFALNRTQRRRLADGDRLELYCHFCSCPQNWVPVEPVEITDTSAVGTKQPTNILVVDDDDLTLKLLQKVLEAWEAHIEVAQNGKDALAKLASQNFDLMICDIRMPEMTGQELFQHIQENALLPSQRILFLTGDKSSLVRQFLDGSGCYYLYKPIQFLELSEQVQALLSNRPLP